MTQIQNKSLPAIGTLLAALDVGSTRLVCLLARITDNQGGIEVLGVGHQAAKGIAGGVITDMTLAEAAIRETIHQAESMAKDVLRDTPLHQVIVSVPGGLVEGQHHHVKIALQGQDVGAVDIANAIRVAQDQAHQDGQELIHAIPTGFTLDGHRGIENPHGMSGTELGVEVHVVRAPLTGLKNLASCIEASHLGIETLCTAPYAAALSVMEADERNLGCILIDIGGHTTSYAVFRKDRMVAAGSIPLGGHHVSSDIAQGMNTAQSNAERIKILYGSAIATISDDHDMIDVTQLGDDEHDEPAHVPRSMLVGIMQPRLEEIFEMVRARLDEIPAASVNRVVLTGGAAQTSALKDLCQMILNKQVRIGRPDRVEGLPDSACGPSFSCVLGLLYYAIHRGDERPYMRIAQAQSDHWLARAWGWLKENW